jgi:hypothetical protein
VINNLDKTGGEFASVNACTYRLLNPILFLYCTNEGYIVDGGKKSRVRKKHQAEFNYYEYCRSSLWTHYDKMSDIIIHLVILYYVDFTAFHPPKTAILAATGPKTSSSNFDDKITRLFNLLYFSHDCLVVLNERLNNEVTQAVGNYSFSQLT